MAGTLSRKIGDYQYPTRPHAPYLIHVPRRGDSDLLAARVLRDFAERSVQTHGAALGLHAPAQPVHVYLFESELDAQRFGPPGAELLKENEGLYDPARRAIAVRMEAKLQLQPVTAALQAAAARLLLHDAAPAGMSPWLLEGLLGRIEGAPAGDLYRQGGDLPKIKEILEARESDFQKQTPSLVRGARLLVACLEDKRPQEFSSYYREEQQGGPGRPGAFHDRFGDPADLELEWKDWLRLLK